MTLTSTLQDSSLQLDALDNDGDPFPITGADGKRESHGTNCAGVVAMMKNNSYCGVGVAYNSQVTGTLVLLNYLKAYFGAIFFYRN